MKITTLINLLCLTAVAPSFGAAQEARRYTNPASPGNGALPFSGAVQVGNTLYLSGHIGLNENRVVPNSAAAEARAVLDAVKETIEGAGMTMDDLVVVQVFCSDVAHYDAFNAVYRTYFTKEFPARAFIGSGGLLFDARFEVQGIAIAR
jgi:2-iminobutanoate/2-iminopropanoate deaminase